jgi:pimeloyl-ACP methyl ester carboxylesterase
MPSQINTTDGSGRDRSERAGTLDRGDGIELAYAARDGRAPAVVFFPGFSSDMTGIKATFLDSLCAERGHAFLRFDYSGHGTSGGRFVDGTISRWRDDAVAVIDAMLPSGPLLFVGSSMGGWIALLAALARGARVAGLIGIAAAPDFTEDLMLESLTYQERAQLRQAGTISVPNPYGPPTPITRALIEDGRQCRVLTRGILPIEVKVRLLHGQQDREVPWELALRTAAAIGGTDVQVTLIKDGDHRLSRPEDLALLRRTLLALLDEDGA